MENLSKSRASLRDNVACLDVWAEEMVSPRVVYDGWRRNTKGDKFRAYDSEDVVERYAALSEQLSESELERLSKIDETEMLVASLAETVHLEVFPYKLFEFEGRIGSLTEIEADAGGKIWVFRDVVDMLESRVAKFPNDDRSRAVLSAFKRVIIPELLGMYKDESLVYYSPSATDGRVLEGEYGFMYVLEKKVDDRLGVPYFDSKSIKLNWEGEKYFEALESMGVLVDKTDYPDDYWAIVHQVKKIGGLDDAEVVALGLGISEESELGVESWMVSQQILYGEAREFVETELEDFTQAVIGGAVHQLAQVVERLQLKWIEKKKPDLYREIKRQIFLYGRAELLVACGLLEFSTGFADPTNMLNMGLEAGAGFYCPYCDKFERRKTYIAPGNGDVCPGCRKDKYQIASLMGTVAC